MTESGQSATGAGAAAGTARGDRQAVAAALADIQGSLAVDGYRLDIEDATGQGLSVRIVALPGACEECLAPPEVLAMIISAELDGAYVPEEIDLLSLSRGVPGMARERHGHRSHPQRKGTAVTEAGPTVGLMLATVADARTGLVAPDRVLTAARRAEAAGFDGVYLGDHLLHPHPILESVVTLAAVAAVTERISLGPCVLLFGLRHPVVLAKQLGTLAAFAPGRLRVGVGVGGEYPAEFEAAGVPLAGRGRRMETVLRDVRSLLAGGVEGGDLTFGPVAPDVPFLLAGWKEVSLRRAAAYGDGWIGYLLKPDSFARRRDFLLSCRAELGRADQPFPTGMLIGVHVTMSADAAAEAAAAWGELTKAPATLPGHLFAAGRPDEVAEQLHRFWKAGCTEFMLGPADQGAGYLDQVELLGAEVLPRLRQFS